MSRILIPHLSAGKAFLYNYHLHHGFLVRAFESQGHDVIQYGPPFSDPLGFDESRTMAQVVDMVKPDLLVSMPTRRVRRHWTAVPVPRVSYVCDFHYWNDVESLNGSALLIVRANNAVKHAAMLGMSLADVHWLPFSFDAEEMAKAPTVAHRSHKVFFAGAAHPPDIYPLRSAAIYELRRRRLLADDSVVDGYVDRPRYCESLKRSLFGLACSSRWRLDIAKHVEIPAAGTILLSDGGDGMNDLFPASMYIRHHGNDAADIVAQILGDPGRLADARAMADVATLWAHEHHTDTLRARQLCSLLKDRGLLG